MESKRKRAAKTRLHFTARLAARRVPGRALSAATGRLPLYALPRVFLCFSLCAAFFSCASLQRAAALAAPLVLFEERVAERECIGIEFSFVNFGAADLERVRFFAEIGAADEDAYDDGAQYSEYAPYALYERDFEFEIRTAAGQEERIFIPFEEIGSDYGADELVVRRLCVQEILFSDGRVWQGR